MHHDRRARRPRSVSLILRLHLFCANGTVSAVYPRPSLICRPSFSAWSSSFVLSLHYSEHHCLEFPVGSGGSRDGKSGHGPLSKLAIEFGPPRGRKSNDSIVNLSKCNDFAPPVSMSVTDLPPPLWENTTIKHEKGR